MGMKPRKRSVVLWASRDPSELSGVEVWTGRPFLAESNGVYTEYGGHLLDIEGPPLVELAPGECRQVRVTIDEVE